ncbi:MAG: cytochrome c maturation protein CcmE [Bacteroidetes bacterium]|nr:cytochrome c maturation protein CcmE [Bacteroidota bacterium]
MKLRPIIGLVALVGFTFFLLKSFGGQIGAYMDFEQAEASKESRVHVVGQWVQERGLDYDPTDNVLRFTMKDELGNLREVHYLNPKPANFEKAERLVIEGSTKGDIFVADKILTKCPSKYNDGSAPEVSAS